MRNKTLIVLTVWVIVYGAVTAALFNGIKQPLILFSVAIGVGLVGFGTYLSMLKPTSDSQGRTQQYIIATTVQILGALGYLLFARFAASTEFKPLAIHFMIAFIGALAFQSVMLISELNRK